MNSQEIEFRLVTNEYGVIYDYLSYDEIVELVVECEVSWGRNCTVDMFRITENEIYFNGTMVAELA